jgi:hypothetical protein
MPGKRRNHIRQGCQFGIQSQPDDLPYMTPGVGKLQGQEGVGNLVEALLVAGSKSVVASCGTRATLSRVR